MSNFEFEKFLKMRNFEFEYISNLNKSLKTREKSGKVKLSSCT
jgi:hypothetical protein